MLCCDQIYSSCCQGVAWSRMITSYIYSPYSCDYGFSHTITVYMEITLCLCACFVALGEVYSNNVVLTSHFLGLLHAASKYEPIGDLPVHKCMTLTKLCSIWVTDLMIKLFGYQLPHFHTAKLENTRCKFWNKCYISLLIMKCNSNKIQPFF